MTVNEKWDKTDDWFWEGNIQERIIRYMKNAEGFHVVESANTAMKTQGPDILAERHGVRRRVAVKGYPSDKYVSGNKKGQKKPTNPILQARHWFAEAILELVLARSANPKLEIALGFPTCTRYVNLLNSIRWFRDKMQLYSYLVSENGSVNTFKPEALIE